MSNSRDAKILKLFGQNLRKLREARGFTSRGFADHAEIAHSQVWKLETGKASPSLLTLITLAKSLDITIEQLITKDLFF